MIGHVAAKRVSIRLLHMLFVGIIAAAAFAAGMYARPWTGSAATTGISACVNKYTGAVRMGANGVTNCSTGETKISWAASDTHGVGEVVTRSGSINIASLAVGSGTVDCPQGYVATGGGFAKDLGPDMFFRTSAPSNSNNGWYVTAYNPNATPETVGLWVRCALP